MCETVEASRRAAAGLSAAMEDSRMLDLDYRAEVAQRKGLPAIGTSKVSAHGIRYEVVDFLPAVSQAGAARVRSGGRAAHISDLLPVISFPEMSERLYELYIETDTVTSRPILFFDTLPDMHPHMAAKGMHQVISPAQGETHCFHFDASDAHETFIAHELGHIWVEMVEQKEDFRHPKDLSDLSKATQFYHIQSFVMDLCVNDLLARRGFDMSVIASDQAQTIVNFADNVANKRPMKGKRVLAGVINALAGTLIEMERFPDEWSETIKAALKVIETGLPEAFEPAKGFVRSVIRHGIANSDAIRRVVDDCARISFGVTSESYDPEHDLVTVEHNEPTWDKRPGFLTGIPSYAKREVFRAAAARGITGTAKYNVFVHGEDGSISVADPAGLVSEPVRIAFRLPYTPVSRPRPAAPTPPPNRHHGISSIPVTIAPTIPDNGFPPTPQSHGLGGFQSFADADPYTGMPGQLTSRRSTCQNPDPFQEERARIDKLNAEFTRQLEEQQNRIRQQNEQIQREYEERQQRIREQNEMLSRNRSESYDGKDLKPCLTPAGEEHATLRQQPSEAISPGRNYMGRVGLWLSQVGWEQEMAGESAYGYANNNPNMFVDPNGMAPVFGPGYSWGSQELQKCRQQPHSAASCFDCAYGYVRESLGTGHQSDYIICVRTNAFCHSHINCENGAYGRGMFPTHPAGPLPPSGTGMPKLGSPFDRLMPMCRIVWPGDVGDFSDFNWCVLACTNTVNRILYSPARIKTLCHSMCATARGSGCEALETRCAALGDTINGQACQLFYNEVCVDALKPA